MFMLMDRVVEISEIRNELECGPMPTVMAAQPNIVGALFESSFRKFRNSIPCTTPQSLADAHCWSAVQ